MKVMQIIKQRFNKVNNNLKAIHKSRYDWPELSTYCGFCKVTTGAYITSVLLIMLTSIYIYLNISILVEIFRNKTSFLNAINENQFSEEAVDFMQPDLFFRAIIGFTIFWTCFKILDIFRNLWIICCIYKKSPNGLRLILYIAVPCWIFDLFLSVIAAMLIENSARVILVLMNISDGYNLLGISSKYKKWSGKSRIVPIVDLEPRSEEIFQNRVDVPCNRDNVLPSCRSLPHCDTCTCFNNQVDNQVDQNHIHSFESLPSNKEAFEVLHRRTSIEPKTLNFKDEAIVFNQAILQESHSPVIENAAPSVIDDLPCYSSINSGRPRNLELKSEQENEGKIDEIKTVIDYSAKY